MPSTIVEVESLIYHYPDGQMALRGVSFSVSDGECVGVVGPNGAGKSTLLLHLNGLLPGRDRYEHEHSSHDHAVGHKADHSHDGVESAHHAHNHVHGGPSHVRVAGLDVNERNLVEVRRRVGLLFQDPDDQLFCPTVGEDVAFGPLNLGLTKDEVRSRVSRSLEAVGLSGFENRSSHHLSFGERKRVCLAGVLACEPTVLALDEPTSNLDPRARRQFLSILKELPAAKIIAAHDLEMMLELSTRVLVLDEGRLCASGLAKEILGDEKLMLAHGLEVPLSLALGKPAAKDSPADGRTRTAETRKAM